MAKSADSDSIEHGLVEGERIGADASTMEANAALRSIVRRDSGETYREMLKRTAEESGIETPLASDLVRIDRTRKGKKLSTADRVSKTDPDAKIAKMKDGTTHLAYKPNTPSISTPGPWSRRRFTRPTTAAHDDARRHAAGTGANLAEVGMAPTEAGPAELVADKGYHSRAVLKDLDGGVWKTRIAEPRRTAFLRWHGDTETPSTPTATGFARPSASRACGNGRRSSSDRSLTTWSAAACVGRGAEGGKTSKNGT